VRPTAGRQNFFLGQSCAIDLSLEARSRSMPSVYTTRTGGILHLTADNLNNVQIMVRLEGFRPIADPPCPHVGSGSH
jgi:hypothetical protein